jgi:hypothetical protein
MLETLTVICRADLKTVINDALQQVVSDLAKQAVDSLTGWLSGFGKRDLSLGGK